MELDLNTYIKEAHLVKNYDLATTIILLQDRFKIEDIFEEWLKVTSEYREEVDYE